MDDRQMKQKQLEILHELDRVCNEVGVRYYLAYGSCLGAVRHQGYIPWDDDIDVVMTVPAMKKLLENRDRFRDNYFIQCRQTEPNWTNMMYNLRDSNTSYFSIEDGQKDINHGMKVDIYLLFPYPDNPFVAHKLIIDTFILRLLYMRNSGELPEHHGRFVKWGSKVVKALYPGKRGDRKIRAVEDKLVNNGGKKYVSVFFGDDITPFSAFKFPVELFQEPKRLKFEDYMAPCPSQPELMCEMCYGKDYMAFPPEEKRQSRHDTYFVSCDEPYTKYEGIYYHSGKLTRE